MVKLMLKLDKSLEEPMYIQLYNHLKKEITAGILEPETRLPSIRQLAPQLKMSRTTVEAAYQQLYAEGYIVSKPKVGYYVNVLESARSYANQPQFPGEGEGPGPGEAAEIKYDFSSEQLDIESFDFTIWRRYVNKALLDRELLLTYGASQGEQGLRKEIAKYIHESRGVVCTPSQIIIGAGVQSLLHILCGILHKRHASIAFEEPGFKKARHIFAEHNFEIVPIKLDRDGMDTRALAGSGVKLVYVSPSHQFPMGSTMSINKRIQLLNWTHDNNALIIEDDYDSELRYFGRPVPSLQGLDEGRSVIYLGTFSKILFPSLRISYMVLPPGLLPLYQEKINQYNQTSSKIEQIALSLYMKEGLLEKQLRKLRKLYARKNQELLDSIEAVMKDKVKIIGGDSGLHIILEIRSGQSPEYLAAQALEAGVRLVPVANYFMEDLGSGAPLVLLSYGGIPAQDIRTAVELLYQVWFGPEK